jgi:hypothetical protein
MTRTRDLLHTGLALCGLTVLLTLAAPPAPALAHDDGILHGYDVATVELDHRYGQVCDNERDGNHVYAVWDIAYPYGRVAETDGGDAPCDYAPRFPDIAVTYKLCEARRGPDSCTRWHST